LHQQLYQQFSPQGGTAVAKPVAAVPAASAVPAVLSILRRFIGDRWLRRHRISIYFIRIKN